MTAEFATVMPAVVLVLALCLAGVQLATLQLRLQDAAAGAARSAARGEPAASISRQVARLVPRATAHHSSRGGLVCVTAALPASGGGLAFAITLAASSCALADGR